jgi:serine protease AprX
VPGSFIDSNYPTGRVGTSYFRGSGTSFAAGVASGAAALLRDREPGLNPNQVKARLTGTAVQVAGGGDNISGSGSIDAYAASHSTSMAEANQGIPFSVGAGSVSADEGSLSVDINTNIITGLLGTVLFDSTWTTDPTGSSWWGSSWWGSSWWGSSWWGSSWWGSSWWGGWE